MMVGLEQAVAPPNLWGAWNEAAKRRVPSCLLGSPHSRRAVQRRRHTRARAAPNESCLAHTEPCSSPIKSPN
eukprot:5514409-Prymnesium_polylepis.1